MMAVVPTDRGELTRTGLESRAWFSVPELVDGGFERWTRRGVVVD